VSLQFGGNDQDLAIHPDGVQAVRTQPLAAFRAHGMTVGFTGGIASTTDQADH
jgi:hypothetical protein